MDIELENKYIHVSDFSDKSEKLLFSSGINAFKNDLYTQVYKNNEISYRASIQNMELEMKRNISKYLPNPGSQMVTLERRTIKYDLSKINDAIFQRDCENVVNAADISKETYEKYKDTRDSITEQQEYELKRYKIRDFYKINTISMEFALEWGLSGKITALSMFAKLFLWSDELFENRDDTALDKYKGDSLIHFDFEGDQKNLFDSFFRVFGLDHESIMMFSFDVENYNHIQVSHLNDILPKFILKDRHHKVPTKLTSAAAIPSMLRQVFFLSGVPLKTTI
jgi:hypothetical protein